MSESNQQHLRHLIKLYFDGATTLEQDRELRRLLAEPWASGADADEARAVMSFACMTPRRKTPRTPLMHHVAASLSAAASVAVAAVIGWSLLAERGQQPECIAYVDGREITDTETVMEIIDSDLDALGKASSDMSDDITDDLSSISNAINIEGS